MSPDTKTVPCSNCGCRVLVGKSIKNDREVLCSGCEGCFDPFTAVRQSPETEAALFSYFDSPQTMSDGPR